MGRKSRRYFGFAEQEDYATASPENTVSVEHRTRIFLTNPENLSFMDLPYSSQHLHNDVHVYLMFSLLQQVSALLVGLLSLLMHLVAPMLVSIRFRVLDLVVVDWVLY